MLIPNPALGTMKKSLSGLVLHFGDGGIASLPCEAAALAASSMAFSNAQLDLPRIRVFVSKSSINTMKQIYSSLGGSVVIEPLAFTQDELDAEAFRSMMAVGSSESIPLYMHTVLVSKSRLSCALTSNLVVEYPSRFGRILHSLSIRKSAE
jgi:hypothetical protein